MFTMSTHVETPACRERIVAAFPLVDAAGLQGAVVVTTDDEKHPEFTVWHLDASGQVRRDKHGHEIGTMYLTLPSALRAARQQNGWG